jgi:hypothetical protein
VEFESEGILGGVGVGKKCTDSDPVLNVKSYLDTPTPEP